MKRNVFDKNYRVSGLSPFVADSDVETMTNVLNAKYSYEYNSFSDVSQQAKDFIDSLLQKEPKKRLTAEKALNHEWITYNCSILDKNRNRELILSVTKTKLKRYVIKKRWRRIFQAVIALRRMGAKFDD